MQMIQPATRWHYVAGFKHDPSRKLAKLPPGRFEAARRWPSYRLCMPAPMRNEVGQGTTIRQGCICMQASVQQNNAIILRA